MPSITPSILTLALTTLSLTQASPHRLDNAHHVNHHLSKRDFSGKATFFSVGLGACGGYNKDSDYIVALNQPQYEANNWCGKTITINYGGKSAQATIVDECPGCAWGSLDLSPGLFQHFASEDAGVFYMTWSLNDGSGGGGDNQPTTQATTTWTPPTTTWTPPTTTWTPPPSTYSASPSSTYSSSSSSSSSASASSSSSLSSSASTNSTLHATSTSSGPAPKGTGIALTAPDAAADGTESRQAYLSGNLNALGQIVVGLGGVVVAGAKEAVAGAK